jgi:hypothetical protein
VSKQPEKKPAINPPDREAIIKKQADTVKALKRIPETRYEEGSVLSVAVSAKFAERLKAAYCGSGAHIGEERPLPLGNDFLISLLKRALDHEEWRQEHIKRLVDPNAKLTKQQKSWIWLHGKLLTILEKQGFEELRRVIEIRAGVRKEDPETVDLPSEEVLQSITN